MSMAAHALDFMQECMTGGFNVILILPAYGAMHDDPTPPTEKESSADMVFVE